MIRPPEIPSNFTHNIAQYAAHRGVSHPLIIKWIKDGKIPASCYVRYGAKNRFILIDPTLADEALKGNLQENKVGRYPTRGNPEPPEKQIEFNSSKKKTKADYDRDIAAQKVRDNEIEYKRKIKELVERPALKKFAFEAGRANQDNMMRLSRRIAPIVASMTNQHEIERVIDEEIRQALENVALTLEKLANE